MQIKTIKKLLVAILIAIFIIIASNSCFAVTPDQITGDGTEMEFGIINDITDIIRLVGTFIAVGVLMIMGIRYMLGSIEERASYKKSMMPYIIGCFILFGAAYIAPMIKDLFSDIGNNATDIGNKILGIIQLVGTWISVGALMIMGIRYIMGSTEERASYKKSMLPYVIGLIILFAAVNITSIIYNMVPKGTV